MVFKVPFWSFGKILTDLTNQTFPHGIFQPNLLYQKESQENNKQKLTSKKLNRFFLHQDPPAKTKM
jgi:hypothetical protein